MGKRSVDHWTGLIQPKRGVCPSCGKKGLGVARWTYFGGVGLKARDCRYCGHVERVDPPSEEKR